MIKKKNLSQEDKKAWDDFIKDPSNIYDKDNNNQKKSRKERFKFDLHGFTLDDANQKVREILFITGKGNHSTNEKDIYISKDLGKLKYSVPEFIKTDEELPNLVISIDDADIKDGGEGAILVKLKNL